MTTSTPVVTAERFAQGMTFEEYLRFIASPANLSRGSNDGGPRFDRSAQLNAWYGEVNVNLHQAVALRELASMPGGPAKMLAIGEEWSSDSRRDIPMAARVAEAAGLELRIFTRDGDTYASAPSPEPGSSPNADLMVQFLNHKNGRTWQSIPVIAYFDADMNYLYHYTEYPAIYDKDRLVVGHMRQAQPGETPDQAKERYERDFAALQQGPFFHIWACAGVDEQISALQRRLILGAV